MHPPVPLVLLLVGLASLLVACSSDGSVPKTLMDGSTSRAPPVELEGISSPAILTKVQVVSVGEVQPGSLSARCLGARGQEARPSRALVERIGVTSTTVTYAAASGLHGCDDTAGARDDDRRWCGLSFGRFYDDHLRDPRLDMAGCRTADGEPVALAWIEPGGTTSYVAVEQAGYTEVYEIAGAVPIRIATTTGIEIQGSRATFRLTEHDATGRRLREYELVATPAG